MKLILVHFQTEEEINLDVKAPVIIGRGSLFGCSDKKISRNHGRIQLTPEGNVHLLALHTNPCFFMRNGLPPVLQLAKDEEKILNNGDYIGLLPDSFWYKIVVKHDESENCTELLGNSSQDSENECQLSKDGISDMEVRQINIKDDGCNLVSNEEYESCDILPDMDEPSNARRTNDEASKPTWADEEPSAEVMNNESVGENSAEPKQIDSADSWLKERLRALEKTKKLPLSMYEIDDITPLQNVNFEKCQDSSENKNSGDENEGDSTAVLACTKTTLFDKVCSENSSKEGSTSNLEVKESGSCANSSKTLNITKLGTCDINSPNSPSETLNRNTDSSRKRPICQYEGKCFRKNELHLREFCHPGDIDFVPYTKRPKCQYGTSCYRRNRTHLVEFQHPQSKKLKRNSPIDSPKGKRQKRKEEIYPDSSEENDYDWEDPFLNIESSDEYIPSDLDSEDDEDDFNLSSSVSTHR